MNAYELAEKLNDAVNKNEKHLTLDIQAMLMLREQANRIAELEKTMGERLNDLNTRQVEDERTSLVSTPPYAYAVVQGEDGRENVSLQFDHPEMCGQQYKQAIPLFTTPQDQADRIAELEKLVHQRFDDGKRLGVLETEDKFKSPPCAWMIKTNDGKKLMLYGEEQPPKFEGEVQYIPLYTTPQTKPLKRLNKQEIARYMFSQNTGQDIGQMLIEYFCDKNGLTLEYIED